MKKILFKKSANLALLITSIILFLASLSQKCYCTTSICNDSMFVFLLGPLGLWFSWAGATWLVNPLLITSWVSINKNSKLSLWMSVLASALSLSFLLFSKVMDNENGNLVGIISYKLGYWLWVGSSFTMLICNFVSISLKYKYVEE